MEPRNDDLGNYGRELIRGFLETIRPHRGGAKRIADCENCGRFVAEIPAGVSGVFYCSTFCHKKDTQRRL